MSSSSTYFSSMLQRMMLEAHGVPMPPVNFVLPSSNSEAILAKYQQQKRTTSAQDRVAERKRKNLEQKIQRLKMFKAEERETPSERWSSEESSDNDVDVVGGVVAGPMASDMNIEEEMFEDIVAQNRMGISQKKQQIPKAPLECDMCGKGFASPFQLKEHISIQHLNERNFVCDQCDQKFGRRGGLRRHVQMVHQNHLHKCPYADCSHPGYKCSKALTAHIRSVHTNVRPFVCEECQKAFVRKNDLKMHRMTHLKNASFTCACGSSFRRQIYLRKHQRTCFIACDNAQKELQKTTPSGELRSLLFEDEKKEDDDDVEIVELRPASCAV